MLAVVEPSHDARCVALSLARDEPLYGSAPTERAWLLVEQEKPWGRNAFRESDFDREIAAEVDAAAKANGVRVLVVRQTRRARTRPTAFLAWTGSGGFIRRLDDVAPRDLLELDLAALSRGEPVAGEPHDGPLFLVCTNGRRDPCCATRGTAAARVLRHAFPEETYECSHLGGHRFAATMLALPSGACFGRLTPDDARHAADELTAGRLVLEHLRGTVGREPAVQAAEVLLRSDEDLRGVDDVEPVCAVSHGDTQVVDFRTPEGRPFSIRIQREQIAEGPLSCAGKIEPIFAWRRA
jgi:hypothetical protein